LREQTASAIKNKKGIKFCHCCTHDRYFGDEHRLQAANENSLLVSSHANSLLVEARREAVPEGNHIPGGSLVRTNAGSRQAVCRQAALSMFHETQQDCLLGVDDAHLRLLFEY